MTRSSWVTDSSGFNPLFTRLEAYLEMSPWPVFKRTSFLSRAWRKPVFSQVCGWMAAGFLKFEWFSLLVIITAAFTAVSVWWCMICRLWAAIAETGRKSNLCWLDAFTQGKYVQKIRYMLDWCSPAFWLWGQGVLNMRNNNLLQTNPFLFIYCLYRKIWAIYSLKWM